MSRKLTKTSFQAQIEPFFKWPILGPANLSQHSNHHQLLDTLTLYHNMQNQQKLMHIDQENYLKPHFGPFFGPNWPIFGPNNFFFENRALSLFYTHRRLTCCKKSEKSYGGKYENFGGLTDGLTD